MALIRNFARMRGHGSIHQTETDAGWATVTNSDEPLLYVATHGSSDRQSSPKPSQVIHLDRAGATELPRTHEQARPAGDRWQPPFGGGENHSQREIAAEAPRRSHTLESFWLAVPERHYRYHEAMDTFNDPAYFSNLTPTAYSVLDRAAASMDDPANRRDIDDSLRARAHAALAGIAPTEENLEHQVQDALKSLGIDLSEHSELLADAVRAVEDGAFTHSA